ncbi:hypothetical protein [Dyella sp.]|uniref:hypothetical protein n=1 Tax=Dyella sp. TaxID=1869338 RepID=UPI003F7E7BD9
MQNAYFIMTPGAQLDTYVKYGHHGAKGNYFKFGDTNAFTTLGVRGGYTTHNPDSGVAGVITNQMAAHNLGTRIKNDIILSGLHPIPGTEWFSVQTVAAWQLFRLILNHYDGRIVNDGNYGAFRTAVLNLL